MVVCAIFNLSCCRNKVTAGVLGAEHGNPNNTITLAEASHGVLFGSAAKPLTDLSHKRSFMRQCFLLDPRERLIRQKNPETIIVSGF
tara:strand:+ start:1586 stop:1846 length:261 start_codon:yes stop_codon:yes gene_type:complete